MGDEDELKNTEDFLAEDKDENTKDKNESPEISADNSNEEQGDEYRSYVLWRPSVLDDSGLLQSHRRLLDFLRNFMSREELPHFEDKNTESQGRKDDTKQMNFPRVLPLTDRNEPSTYDNFVNSFNNLKETVNDAVSRPEVKDNMFYILMGLSGFLLLLFLNENLFDKQKPRSVQNHYLLQDTGAAAKLPTYEECMRTEKNILVSLADKDVFNKVDLSLPVLAVTKETVVKKE